MNKSVLPASAVVGGLRLGLNHDVGLRFPIGRGRVGMRMGKVLTAVHLVIWAAKTQVVDNIKYLPVISLIKIHLLRVFFYSLYGIL